MSVLSVGTSLSNSTESEKHAGTVEFLLLGLSEDTDLQPTIFGLFLFMYLVTLVGNLLIILVIICDSHLHTPMYFFLSNLSFSDMCFISTTVPKMLVNIQRHNKIISYTGCLAQVCFVLVFAGIENCLLAAMAYDRYVAVCHPLRYTVIMNPRLCVLLILLSLTISITYALLQSLMLLRLSFCRNLEIPHFFCEIGQVIKLACSDNLINNILEDVSDSRELGQRMELSKHLSTGGGLASTQPMYTAIYGFPK
ncbi:Hypothetical predicted protein [Marmota monax]|uniref:Olfactory receptor n=1 Tax=Marmota monax TaxID=9995 RepID=A0A5E4CKP0_MARMO|nr:Hypothetical predicted protein [Marmota monax]